MANIKIHFLKLVNLFEGYIPIFPTLRLDIKGNHSHFTIKKVHGYPYLYAGLFVAVFIVPFLLMIRSNFKSVRFWAVAFLILGAAWVIFRFLSVSKSILLNAVDRNIILENRNIFGKPISKPLWIQFSNFKKLASEPQSKTINKFGQKVLYQRIYILYHNEKRFLMDLPQNFQQTADGQNTFTECLEAIIRNG